MKKCEKYEIKVEKMQKYPQNYFNGENLVFLENAYFRVITKNHETISVHIFKPKSLQSARL